MTLLQKHKQACFVKKHKFLRYKSTKMWVKINTAANIKYTCSVLVQGVVSVGSFISMLNFDMKDPSKVCFSCGHDSQQVVKHSGISDAKQTHIKNVLFNHSSSLTYIDDWAHTVTLLMFYALATWFSVCLRHHEWQFSAMCQSKERRRNVINFSSLLMSQPFVTAVTPSKIWNGASAGCLYQLVCLSVGEQHAPVHNVLSEVTFVMLLLTDNCIHLCKSQQSTVSPQVFQLSSPTQSFPFCLLLPSLTSTKYIVSIKCDRPNLFCFLILCDCCCAWVCTLYNLLFFQVLT